MTKEQLKKFLKNNKFDIQKARANFFAISLVFTGYTQSRLTGRDVINPTFCYVVLSDLTNYFYQIVEEKVLYYLANKTYQNFLKIPTILKAQAKARKKIVKELDRIWLKYYRVKQSDLIITSLLSVFKQMLPLCHDYWGYSAIIGEDKGMIIDRKIIPQFAKRHNIDLASARDAFGVLTHPDVRSIFNKERISYLKLCLYLAKSEQRKNFLSEKRLQLMIKEYINNFFWIKTDFCLAKKINSQSLLESIKADIKAKGLAQFQAELKSINNNFLEIKEKKRKLLKTIKLSQLDNKDIGFAKINIIWHDERKMEMMKQFYYLFSILEDAAKLAGNSYQMLTAYTPPEIIKILEQNKKIYRKKRACFVVFARGKKLSYFLGSQAKELLKVALNTQDNTEIKGIVASRNQAKSIRGIVNIIYNPNKQKFRVGEILVTSMTRVEFMPLMRKAKAIITDEGGIACHAAIVSRELGIPCIIGTKIATQALKSGQMIEINTGSGIIKVLK